MEHYKKALDQLNKGEQAVAAKGTFDFLFNKQTTGTSSQVSTQGSIEKENSLQEQTSLPPHMRPLPTLDSQGNVIGRSPAKERNLSLDAEYQSAAAII